MKPAHLFVAMLAVVALVAFALVAGGAGPRAPGLTPRADQSALLPSTATVRPALVPTASAAGIPVGNVGDPIDVASPVAPDTSQVSAAPPFDVAPQVPETRAPISVASPIAEGWGPLPAPDLDPRPFSEAHWQGLEAIPRTKTLIETLKLPPDALGVILDDVTLPADLQGFRAGDLVTAINGVPTPNLLAFVQASDRVREDKRVVLDIVRSGEAQRMHLVALFDRLGTANAETPAMIPPGARSPHPYQGPCLNCHRIGTTGSLAADQGDPTKLAPPPIRPRSVRPHRDRGPCTSCHRILP